MSYLTWRKEKEAIIKHVVDNGEVASLPAWDHVPHDFIIDNVATPVVDEILKSSEWDPISVSCVWAEYLYERYNIDPIDVEIMTQMIIKSFMTSTKTYIDKALQNMSEKLKEEFQNEEGED